MPPRALVARSSTLRTRRYRPAIAHKVVRVSCFLLRSLGLPVPTMRHRVAPSAQPVNRRRCSCCLTASHFTGGAGSCCALVALADHDKKWCGIVRLCDVPIIRGRMNMRAQLKDSVQLSWEQTLITFSALASRLQATSLPTSPPRLEPERARAGHFAWRAGTFRSTDAIEASSPRRRLCEFHQPTCKSPPVKVRASPNLLWRSFLDSTSKHFPHGECVLP